VGLDLGLRQDIEWGYSLIGTGTLLNPARDPFAKYGPGTLQRLPALTFGWSPSKRWGPLRFDLEGDAVRLAPLFSKTGDEGMAAADGAVLPEAFAVGVDRLFTPSATSAFGTPRVGIGDRLWQPGEREARDRLMVMPRLSVSALPLEAVSVSAFAGWRQFGWAGEASGRTWSRGYLLLGGRLETEVSRWFGGGALRHVIQPTAEVRAIPGGLSGASGSSLAPALPFPVPYDAVDAAVPSVTPRFQGVVELRQRLTRRDGSEVLRLDVGQGFELSGADYSKLTSTLGESFGRVSARIGWFSGQGLLRLDPLSGRVGSDGLTPVVAGGITRVAGQAALDDAAGHRAYVAYENILMEGTSRSRQPIDLLFLIDRGFTSATRVRQLTFGASWNFGKLSLSYDALVSDKVLPGAVAGAPPVLALAQQSFGVGFTPACDCWRVEGIVRQPINTDAAGLPVLTVPNFGFSVTISKFGSIVSR
jgi:LPS-assembly protein